MAASPALVPAIMKGVYAAVLTPLNGDMSPDLGHMTAHCQWLLANGCDGLVILGTTGEAQSFSVGERMDILTGLGRAGIPMDRAMPGTGAAACVDTIALTRHALETGAGGVLVLPPYYLKNVTDEGLFAAFAQIIEGVDKDSLRLYLYHFPQMSGVPLSLGLIARLVEAFPHTVVGVKDSSGDVNNMLAMIERFPGFAVFPGSEQAFPATLKAGGAGCITAISNAGCAMMQRIYSAWTERGETDHEAEAIIQALRTAIVDYPLAPALKALTGRHRGDAPWERVRPPLMPLDAPARTALFAAVDEIGYNLPPVWPPV